MTKHSPKYTLSLNLFLFVYVCYRWEYSVNFLFIPQFFLTLGMNKFTLPKKCHGEVRVGARDGYIVTPILQMQIFIHINAEIYSYY